jgi:DNA-binding IscR family transcriptional regulator
MLDRFIVYIIVNWVEKYALNQSSHCCAHRVWKQARDQPREILAEASFAKLPAEKNCKIPFL